MLSICLVYRDVDRLPYLYAVQTCARADGLAIALERHVQSGPEDWGERLKRGEVDALAENYWGLQRLRAAGAPFVTVAAGAQTLLEYLMVRPEVKTLDDLRGKKIIIRNHGPQFTSPAVILAQLGLRNDVELVQETETERWGHWKEVADGTGDACFMTPLYAEPAFAAGLQALDYPTSPFPFVGGLIVPTLTESYVAANEDTVGKLVRAMFAACRRISADPAWLFDIVRTRCLEALREHFTFRNDDDVARFARTYQSEVAPDAYPTLPGLQNALEVARLQYTGLDDFNPLTMWDLSFANRALRGAA
jgi:ABC-type nitrate/sulfonate/bicarbonate transport system substrate-binding protein